MEKTKYTINEETATLTSERSFSVPRSRVWTAWTTKEALEAWWAPKPWRAVTKSFDFSEGGRWHYYMAGPAGEKEWGYMDYLTITPEEEFTATDVFCDEEAMPRSTLPSNNWSVQFMDEEGGTRIIVHTKYASMADLQVVIDMGMKEGFAMALQNLEELLEATK